MIIAIDGPAGAGKSTVARELAERLGFQLVDTGAMYRCVAYESLKEGVDLENGADVAQIAQSLHFEFRFIDGENVPFCNGEALNQEIRTAEVSRVASITSAHREVREVLVEQQRRVGKKRSSVLEGRDIGTVVFPNADLKVFISASPEVRARRRLAQMEENGESGDYQEVLQEIIDRDHRDQSRDVAPLKRAEGAIDIDSSHRSVEEILQELGERVSDLRSENS